MNTANRQSPKIGENRRLHAFVFVLAILSFMLNSANAYAVDLQPTDYRIAKATAKFDGTQQFAVVFKMRPPRRLRANRLELAVGSISASAEGLAFVSLGPVWRSPVSRRSLFAEFGFSPTLLTRSTLRGRELGGNFHFTTSVAVVAGSTRLQRRISSLESRHRHDRTQLRIQF